MKMRKSVILSVAIFLALASFGLLPSLGVDKAVNHTQSSPVPVYGYKIINVYPHDKTAFTEGLVYDGKTLYESTGLYDNSTLRQVDLTTGRILKLYKLPDEFFGEGLTLWKDQLIQLTWQSEIGFVYNDKSFNQTSAS